MKHAEIISSQKAPQTIPSNTPLACPCPQAKQSIIQKCSNTHTKQSQEPDSQVGFARPTCRSQRGRPGIRFPGGA